MHRLLVTTVPSEDVRSTEIVAAMAAVHRSLQNRTGRLCLSETGWDTTNSNGWRIAGSVRTGGEGEDEEYEMQETVARDSSTLQPKTYPIFLVCSMSRDKEQEAEGRC